MADILIEGLDKLEAKLGRLASVQILAPPMARSLARLNSFMATYPPARPQPQPFKTAKQRRWFFWAIKAGVITVPYRRTGQLGRSWAMRVQQTPTQIIGILDNPTPYGPWVQAPPPQQAMYHAGNWRTTEDATKKLSGAIVGDFRRAIQEALK